MIAWTATLKYPDLLASGPQIVPAHFDDSGLSVPTPVGPTIVLVPRTIVMKLDADGDFSLFWHETASGAPVPVEGKCLFRELPLQSGSAVSLDMKRVTKRPFGHDLYVSFSAAGVVSGTITGDMLRFS